jgi:hypothetical protein
MAIKLESTTDSKEAVTAALGGLAEEKVEEIESASAENQQDETTEDSETSDAKEGEESIVAKDSDEDQEESEESDEDQQAKDDKPKKKGGFKKKIDRLTRTLSAKDQEIEHWRSLALKDQAKKDDAPDKSQKATSNDEPKEDDFNTHKEYVKALTDWHVKKALSERDLEDQKNSAKSEFKKVQDEYVKRQEDFKKSHDDFNEVVEEILENPIPIVIEDVILTSENGPELLYELAKQPEEYARIYKLPAIAAAKELGKFEARLQKTESKKSEVKKTKAPPPIRTLKSASTGSGKKSIYDESLSFKEYEKLREKEMKGA